MAIITHVVVVAASCFIAGNDLKVEKDRIPGIGITKSCHSSLVCEGFPNCLNSSNDTKSSSRSPNQTSHGNCQLEA